MHVYFDEKMGSICQKRSRMRFVDGNIVAMQRYGTDGLHFLFTSTASTRSHLARDFSWEIGWTWEREGREGDSDTEVTRFNVRFNVDTDDDTGELNWNVVRFSISGGEKSPSPQTERRAARSRRGLERGTRGAPVKIFREDISQRSSVER